MTLPTRNEVPNHAVGALNTMYIEQRSAAQSRFPTNTVNKTYNLYNARTCRLARSSCLSQSSQDVGVTGVQNGNDTDSEQLTDSGTQLVVATLEVVDLGLGQHGVVLQLRLSQDWGVGSDDDQLGLTLSQSLDGRLVT